MSLDLAKLGKLVKCDASLTHRLLRLVNSPGAFVRQEGRSVESTLLAVDEGAFRRIATLAITGDMNIGRNPSCPCEPKCALRCKAQPNNKTAAAPLTGRKRTG